MQNKKEGNLLQDLNIHIGELMQQRNFNFSALRNILYALQTSDDSVFNQSVTLIARYYCVFYINQKNSWGRKALTTETIAAIKQMLSPNQARVDQAIKAMDTVRKEANDARQTNADLRSDCKMSSQSLPPSRTDNQSYRSRFKDDTSSYFQETPPQRRRETLQSSKRTASVHSKPYVSSKHEDSAPPNHPAKTALIQSNSKKTESSTKMRVPILEILPPEPKVNAFTSLAIETLDPVSVSFDAAAKLEQSTLENTASVIETPMELISESVIEQPILQPVDVTENREEISFTETMTVLEDPVIAKPFIDKAENIDSASMISTTEVVSKIPEVSHQHPVDDYCLDASFFTEILWTPPLITDEIFEPEIEIQQPVPENKTYNIPVQPDFFNKDTVHPVSAINIPPPESVYKLPATAWATKPSYTNMHQFHQGSPMMVTNPASNYASNQSNPHVPLAISAPPPIYTQPRSTNTVPLSPKEKWNSFLNIIGNTPVNQRGVLKTMLQALPGCNNQEDIVNYLVCINDHLSGNFAEYSKALDMVKGKTYFRILMLLGGNAVSVNRMVTGFILGRKGIEYAYASYSKHFLQMLQAHLEEINMELAQTQRDIIKQIVDKYNLATAFRSSTQPIGAPKKQKNPAHVIAQPFLARGVSGNMGVQHLQITDSPDLLTKQSFFASRSEKQINNKRKHGTAFFSENVSIKKRIVEKETDYIQHVQTNIPDKLANNPLAVQTNLPINPVANLHRHPAAYTFNPQRSFTPEDIEKILSPYNAD